MPIIKTYTSNEQAYRELRNVAYLGSSGSQYINLNYNPNANTKCDVIFKKPTSTTGNNGLFGNGYTGIRFPGTTTIRGGFGNGSWVSTTITTLDINTLHFEKGNTKYNGSTLNIPTGTNYTSGFYLFAYNENGVNYGIFQICSFKMYEGNSLLHDFQPVVLNNVGYMYDRVGFRLYGNDGSGSFTIGNKLDISVSPANTGWVDRSIVNEKMNLNAIANTGYEFVNWLLKGYTQLEYIESTGTQYIDTLIPVNTIGTNLKSVIDMQLTTTTQKAFSSMGIGSWGSGGYYLDLISSMQENSYKFCVKSGENNSRVLSNNDTNRHTFTLDMPNGKAYIDNQTPINVNTYSTTSSGNIYLLANGQLGSNGIFGSTEWYAKFYGAKLYLSSNLIRDFIPVIRHSDAQVGLLDLVELKFYGNSGSGEFIGGNAL